MQETKESKECGPNPICDALRYIGDVSYAIFPREVAHDLGEMKKNFLGCIYWLVEKQIKWVDDRVAGGDRLREEWQESCRAKTAEPTAAASET
jgi:hypothetical protein